MKTGRERFCLRSNVLRSARSLGVRVGHHVARAAAARRVDGSFDGWRLEALLRHLGVVGGVGHIARSATAVGGDVAHDGFVRWQVEEG